MEGENRGGGEDMQCSDINSRGYEGVTGSLILFTTVLFQHSGEYSGPFRNDIFFGK